MAYTNQNYAWYWLSNSKTRESSLKKRLLIRIGFVLLVTWVLAVVATKLLAFDKTRDFLEKQTLLLASNWVNILSTSNVNSNHIEASPNQLILAWRDNQLILQQGDILLEKPNKNNAQIKKIGEHKWIINTQCKNNLCVLAGFKDTVRKCAVRNLIFLIFLPLLAIFLLAMIAMYYAVRSGLQPLSSLTRTVSDTPTDKLVLLPEQNRTQELSPLTKSINQLITNMQHQLEKERSFLDTCTHELRTPVTALATQIQTLETKNPTLKSQLEKIHLSAIRTVRVANQFLSLARSNNADKLKNNYQHFDLCELMRQTLIDLLSNKPNVECQMKGEHKLFIQADSLSIEFLFRNIIENILKYALSPNNEKGEISILFKKDGECFRLTVEDSGKGVDPRHYHNLCERFYRASGTDTSGAGLGLSIVKEIAEYYGGKVLISKSETLGGLKITVELFSISQGPSNIVI